VRIPQTTPYDSPGTLSVAKNLSEILAASLHAGVPNRAVVGSNWLFSTNSSLYIGNGAR